MNYAIDIPKNVELILHELNEHGFEAYIVGGCVRDSIMNRTPKDWDICTSALPEQVMEVFENYKIIPTGLKHGTVTLVVNDEQYEITTYRIDGEYEDNRHPKEVKFTSCIEDDLSRRDFTINAMAYNPGVGLIDIFGGKDDIEKKVIRCVGNAEQRFEEDALRILRAMRFAIRYDFVIELDTVAAMNKCKYLLSKISEERINSELTQMLSCKGENICFTFSYAIDVLKVIVPELRFVLSDSWLLRLKEPNEIYTRLALFFDFYNPETILRRMRFDNKAISSVSNIRKYGQTMFYSDDVFENETFFAKWLLNRIGYDDTIAAIQYAKTYAKAGRNKHYFEHICEIHNIVEKVYSNNECYQLSSLKVNGTDVMNAGFIGKEIGKILNKLLEMVMRGDICNERPLLLEKLGSMKNEV